MSKIAIIDRGFISPYWSELFKMLNSDSDHAYTVFHGKPPTGTGLRAAQGPFDFPNVEVRNIEIGVGKTRIIYQPLILRVLRDFDAIIISHELKFVSSMILAFLFKLKRCPVIFWGYGFHATRSVTYEAITPTWKTRLLAGIKRAILGLSDAYLAYTNGGRESLIQDGYPSDSIWVVRQAVNMERQTRLHDMVKQADKAAIRSRYGVAQESVLLLYIGRVVPAKNVPDIVRLILGINEQLGSDAAEAIIVGSGPDYLAVRELAEMTNAVHVLGEIYDELIVAELMHISDAVILPGAAGITVTHAFAFGLPVITRKSAADSPEAEYVVDRVNGLCSDDSFDELLDCAVAFCRDSNVRRRLQEGALESRAGFSLGYMVRQFQACTGRVLSRDQSLTNGSKKP